jgi:hypothetical protein
MLVCCDCCVLSGRGLSDELITRPEESYRLWCVVVCDLETPRMRRPWPALGRSATKKKCIYITVETQLWRLTWKCSFYRAKSLITVFMKASFLTPFWVSKRSMNLLVASYVQPTLHVRAGTCDPHCKFHKKKSYLYEFCTFPRNTSRDALRSILSQGRAQCSKWSFRSNSAP